jgi:DNA-binding NtrC family response regulator
MSSNAPVVLIVDDDEDVLKSAELTLGRGGFATLTARTPAECRSALACAAIDVVVLDLNFSRDAVDGQEGLRLLTEIVAHDPSAVVVVLTGHSGVNVAVSAMRAGASDFVMKPWNNDRLRAVVAAAADRRLEARPPDVRDVAEPVMIGDCPAIARARDLIRLAAPADAPVFLRGEPGVGKTLAAHMLHRQSGRRSGPFVAVDLQGAEGARIETELFDQVMSRARSGVLALDGVEHLASHLQGRLADRLVAEEGDPNAPRIVAIGARRDLDGAKLTQDLSYRLSTIEIDLPPLRERDGDAAVLARHFLRYFAGRHGRAPKDLSDGAAQMLDAASWPGNVRELRQVVERIVILVEGPVVEPADIALMKPPGAEARTPSALNLARTERALVETALRQHGFNVSRAARELGLTRSALYRRMAKHGL